MYDVVVVGAGMAGLTAGAQAARSGLRPLVVEKAAAPGGSGALSGGVLWRPRTKEVMAALDPGGNRAPSDRIIDSFDETVHFIESMNVSVGPLVDVLDYGKGRLIDILGYLHACRRMIERAGGNLIMQSEVKEIYTSRGMVSGCLIEDQDGSSEIDTGAVILATGGFQGDHEMRSAHLGKSGGELLLRSNPESSGAGLRLGMTLGGQLGPAMHGFYGHMIAWPIQTFGESEYIRLSQMQCTTGVVVARSGDRLLDESLGYPRVAQAAAQQEDPVVAVIFDQAIHDKLTNAPVAGVKGLELIDRVQEAAGAGAFTATASTIEDLAEQLESQGFDPAAVAATVNTFNEAMRGDPEALVPPRLGNRGPIESGPFYAVVAHPAITFTFGGLLIDADGRVLDGQGKPIIGLYAAGADAGVYAEGYGGGLSLAATFGRLAALDAVAVLEKRDVTVSEQV